MPTKPSRKRIAVYAASLDPITFGHINVAERVAPLYDELIVIAAVDPKKTYTFTPDERKEMAAHAVAHLPNVRVEICDSQYVVRMAKALGAQVIIRGLRNTSDLEFEQNLASGNRRIFPEIETIWVPCLPHLMDVSSSAVKSHIGVDPDWETQATKLTPAVVVAKLKNKYILDKARKHWYSLMARIGNSKPPESTWGPEILFRDILENYGETHRAYHNLEHIVSMLDDFETFVKDTPVPLTLYEYIELAFGIWYHDYNYNPKAKLDDEKRSANIAKMVTDVIGLKDLGETIPSRTHDLVMATKHGPTKPSGFLEQIITDLDLAILGKPESVYDKYEAGIRVEYGPDWVPEADFRKGRAKILQMFLDRKRIYSTNYFQKKYGRMAKANLKRALAKLLA